MFRFMVQHWVRLRDHSWPRWAGSPIGSAIPRAALYSEDEFLDGVLGRLSAVAEQHDIRQESCRVGTLFGNEEHVVNKFDDVVLTAYAEQMHHVTSTGILWQRGIVKQVCKNPPP